MVLLLLAVATAGCKSGGLSSLDNTTTTAAGIRPSSTAPPVSVRAGTGNAFCEFLRTYNEQFGKFNSGLADPQQLRTTMNQALGAIRSAESSAPSDIKADLTTMRIGFENLIKGFEQVGFDVTKLRIDILTSFQTPEFVAASQRMESYTRQNCL